MIKEKIENLEFSNYVLEIENAGNRENMSSGLEPSASTQKRDETMKDTELFGTTDLS